MSLALSVAILAGGKSSRMGQNKALLTIGSKSIIQHVIDAVASLSPDALMIVTNTPTDYEHLGHKMVADTLTGYGAISGIVSALHHSNGNPVLVIACDMPFIQPALLNLLIEQFQHGSDQAVMPTIAGYPQGVLALYDPSCLPHFEAAVNAGQRKLKTIFDSLDNVHYIDESIWQAVDPNGHSFINVNTPDELNIARNHWLLTSHT